MRTELGLEGWLGWPHSCTCDVSPGATGLAGVEKKGGGGLGLARMGDEKSEVSTVSLPPRPSPQRHVLEGSPVDARLLEGVRQNTFIQHVCLIYTHVGGG